MKTNTRISSFTGFLALGAALFCATSGAVAQTVNDPTVAKPTVRADEPFNWTGFYIGLNIGGILQDAHFNNTDVAVDTTQQFNGGAAGRADTITTFDIKDRPDRDGSVIGGGQLGAQFQFGHFVFGIEGDFQRTATLERSRFSGTNLSTLPGAGPNLGNDVIASTNLLSIRDAKSDYVGTLRGRLGWAWNRALFYATGGVTFSNNDLRASDVASTNFFEVVPAPNTLPTPMPGSVPPPGPDVSANYPNSTTQYVGNITTSTYGKSDHSEVGWNAGAGVEVAFTDNISFGLEYRHNDLGSAGHTYVSNGAPSYAGGNPIIHLAGNSTDLDSDQVTVRMNYRVTDFGMGGGHYASVTRAHRNPFLEGDDVEVGYHHRHTTDGKELSSKEKNVVPTGCDLFNWSGLYIGVNGGGSWVDYDWSRFDTTFNTTTQLFYNNPNFINPNTGRPYTADQAAALAPRNITTAGPNPFTTAPTFETSANSVTGGGQLGYQFQFGRFVAGVEGDFNGMSDRSTTQYNFIDTIFGTEPITGFATTTNLYSQRDANVNWAASLRGKLGYAAGPCGRVLLYATGGVSFLDATVDNRDVKTTEYFDTTGGGFVFMATRTTRGMGRPEEVMTGYTAGAGMEWAFTNIASLGMEYRHSGYGNQSFNFTPVRTNELSPGRARIDFDEDQVLVKLNILLGRLRP